MFPKYTVHVIIAVATLEGEIEMSLRDNLDTQNKSNKQTQANLVYCGFNIYASHSGSVFEKQGSLGLTK